MTNDEFEKFLREVTHKFDYTFSSLCFGTLALSLQFSPAMGRSAAFSLVSSWIALFISAVAGGWRLMNQPGFYRINLSKVQLENHIFIRKGELESPEFKLGLELGTIKAVDGISQKEVSMSDLAQRLSIDEKSLKQANKNMDAMAPKLLKAFQIQMWFYLVGLALNLYFCIWNYI